MHRRGLKYGLSWRYVNVLYRTTCVCDDITTADERKQNSSASNTHLEYDILVEACDGFEI